MKIVIQFIGFCLVFYTLILGVLYFFQDKFLFYPGGEPFGDCPGMERRNAGAKTEDGIRYYSREKAIADKWIIIFHGNAGNACDRTYFLDVLHNMNANLVVFEYPGFGKDSNVPGEEIFLKQGIHLIQQIKEKNSEKLPIYLMGESLGTGVATYVATQIDISGLILISAYPSMAQVAQYHYPLFPTNYLIKHKFNADIWASQTLAPVLLFHGTDDDIIPIHFARQQVLNFKGKAEFVEIPDCGHNDLIDRGEQILQEKIQYFLLKTRGN